MLHRRILTSVAIVLATAASLAGCGGSDGASSSPAASDAGPALVAVGDAPVPGNGVGSLGDAVKIAAAAPGQADAAACDIDRQTLETVVAAYEALNGTPPTSQDDLIADKWIEEASPRFLITPDGLIVASPGSPCA